MAVPRVKLSYLMVLLMFSPPVMLAVMLVHQERYSWRSPMGLQVEETFRISELEVKQQTFSCLHQIYPIISPLKTHIFVFSVPHNTIFSLSIS